jgi:hypothetical protein
MSDRSTAAVNVKAQYGLPPNIMFDLLADPRNHASIFDAIEVGAGGAGRGWVFHHEVALDNVQQQNHSRIHSQCD